MEGSTPSVPEARQATHEPGSRKTLGRAVDLGLVAREPGDLRRDVPGVEVAAGERAQRVRVDALGRRLALRARAPVAPDQRGVQRAAVGGGGHQAVELGAEGERDDLAPGGRGADPRQRGDEGGRPLAGVLLGPPRAADSSARAARRSWRPASRRAPAPARRCPASRRRRRRQAARRRSMLPLARAAPQEAERERVGDIVLARDEHGDAVGAAIDLVEREQQGPAGDVETAREVAVGVARRQVRDAVVDGQAALRERGVDRALGDLGQVLGREVLDAAPVASRRRPGARRPCGRGAAQLTGSPSGTPSASATAAGAGTAPELSSTVPGCMPGRPDQRGHAEVAAEVVRQRRAVGDVGPRPVLAADDAVLLEHRDRRAHRRARDRPPPRQLRLGGHAVARPPLTGEDARAQLLREAVAQRPARPAHGATTTFSASPARIRGKASGVSSRPMMSETTERMPPASAASMSSAATWSRWREA